MDLYDGYTRERQPSAATLKRWRPVVAGLIAHLGHDDANRITTDDIIGWKDALAGQGVAGRYSTLLDFIFAARRPFSDAGLLTDQREAVGDGGQLIATRNVAGGEAFLKQAADGGDQ